MNIGNFIGSWYIYWRDGVEGHGIQQDWTLLIGTGSDYGDRKPFLSPDYEVCVGFAMLNQDGAVELSTDPPAPGVPLAPGYPEQPSEQDLALSLEGEQLCWRGEYQQVPLQIYVSAAQTLMAGARKSVHLYGSSTYGDPEQVAVWGGSGDPPPAPKPKKDGGE
jgi:hypothetical protein